jgi:aspartyl/asparaginyl beta-hydroxylase (cupin superfamily)
MIIRDNSTRWNLIYDSILRVIVLYPALILFSFDYEDELGKDILIREDWDDIKKEAAALRPFKDLIIKL